MTAERRFPIAVGASLLVNLIAWSAVGSAFAYRVAPSPPPIEFQRVTVTKEGKKTVKIVKPQDVRKKVERVVKEQHLPPVPKPAVQKPARLPEGAHNKVLTAAPSPTGPSKPDFTALQGGNATPGKPTEVQSPGTAVVNPPEPPKVEPPKADPPKTDPPKVVVPPSDPPKADPPKVDPPKADPPKRKGPSRDAEHSNEVNPAIPDEIKSQEFKKFVRVRVDIPAEGEFTVTLRTSSGNDEVDRRVLEALKKWKWKPKLVDGEPVDSTQLFRFDFEIK